MQSLSIIGFLDELADRGAPVVAVPVPDHRPRRRFSVAMKLSAIVLAHGQPTRLMLGRMPLCLPIEIRAISQDQPRRINSVAVALRIPVDRDHRFRLIAIIQSVRSRSCIPVDRDHWFR
jgi:hypothetical protein